MPAEQPLPSNRGCEVGRGIQHHLDHTFDVTIDRSQDTDVHAQSTRDARTHQFDIELLALDLAGLDYVFGECGEARLVAQRHAHIRQAPHQESLGTTHLHHGPSKRHQVIAPSRPVAGLPNVFVIAAFHAEIMGVLSPQA